MGLSFTVPVNIKEEKGRNIRKGELSIKVSQLKYHSPAHSRQSLAGNPPKVSSRLVSFFLDIFGAKVVSQKVRRER